LVNIASSRSWFPTLGTAATTWRSLLIMGGPDKENQRDKEKSGYGRQAKAVVIGRNGSPLDNLLSKNA
jgi:hypothetical protein